MKSFLKYHPASVAIPLAIGLGLIFAPGETAIAVIAAGAGVYVWSVIHRRRLNAEARRRP